MARRAAILLLILAAACRDEARPAPAPAPDPIARAAAWLAEIPADQLRFDAAIGLAAVVARRDDPALRRAFDQARAVADRDADNPLRRLYDPGAATRPTPPTPWDVPGPGERVNVNRPVAEALHCREHGLRPEALAYVTGPMRDAGGYHTTHAVWTLVIARDQGCLEPARFAELARPLLDELRAAQPAAPPPEALGVDLFAERLLMLALAGERDAAIDGWADALRAAQRPDGGFGDLAPDEDPYHRHHATVIAIWALTALASS